MSLCNAWTGFYQQQQKILHLNKLYHNVGLGLLTLNSDQFNLI